MHPRHFNWLGGAVACIAAPAWATTYFSVEEAQQVLFPQQTLVAAPATLADVQARSVETASGVRVRERTVQRWRAADGGWFYLDQVIGKHEYITYALALDASGAVRGLEILRYNESYGQQVRNPQWRAQFNAKRNGDAVRLAQDIVNLSGATLSCRNLTDGVRRLLATHALLAAAG